MAIKERLTSDIKVISRYDEALGQLPRNLVVDYCANLDIETLGDLTGLAVKPSVFTIRPLSVEYEHLVDLKDPNKTDHWGLFSTHVKNITECFKVTRTDSVIDFKWRSKFEQRTVRDVADIITAKANGGKDALFFTSRDALQAYSMWLTGAKFRTAEEATKELARSAAAKSKKRKPAKSR
jgi:hypothetical protein